MSSGVALWLAMADITAKLTHRTSAPLARRLAHAAAAQTGITGYQVYQAEHDSGTYSYPSNEWRNRLFVSTASC